MTRFNLADCDIRTLHRTHRFHKRAWKALTRRRAYIARMRNIAYLLGAQWWTSFAGIEGVQSMSKPMLSALVVGLAGTCTTAPISAAELPLLPPISHMRSIHAASRCGPCGCLHVSYIYHRELRSTYGSGFDPRNFDETQPHYYFGAIRAYPRYWVEVEPIQ